MKQLLLIVLLSSNLYAHTNKTFLAGRPVGVNLPMEGTTWHTQINKPNGNDNKVGASLQVTGFFQENTNDTALGKYFGFENKRTINIGNADDEDVDVDKRHFLHDHLEIRNHTAPNGLTGNLTGIDRNFTSNRVTLSIRTGCEL